MLNNLKTHDPKLLSMIEYGYYDSYCFEKIRHKEHQDHFIKSIDFYDKHVNNFYKLATYYFEKGDFSKAVELGK